MLSHQPNCDITMSRVNYLNHQSSLPLLYHKNKNKKPKKIIRILRSSGRRRSRR